MHFKPSWQSPAFNCTFVRPRFQALIAPPTCQRSGAVFSTMTTSTPPAPAASAAEPPVMLVIPSAPQPMTEAPAPITLFVVACACDGLDRPQLINAARTTSRMTAMIAFLMTPTTALPKPSNQPITDRHACEPCTARSWDPSCGPCGRGPCGHPP